MRSSPRGATRSKLVSRACTSMLIGFPVSGVDATESMRAVSLSMGGCEPPSRWWLSAGVSGGSPPRSAAEQREHGQDATVVVLGLCQPELLEDPLYVALDRPRTEVE